MSSSLHHGPAGIWTHLDPVLHTVREESPDVNVIHFFSDSPTTQYRNKRIFFTAFQLSCLNMATSVVRGIFLSRHMAKVLLTQVAAHLRERQTVLSIMDMTCVQLKTCTKLLSENLQ